MLTEVADADGNNEVHLQVESVHVVCVYNPADYKYNTHFARDDDDRGEQLFGCKGYLQKVRKISVSGSADTSQR